MITIGKPYIEKRGTETFLLADIKDEKQQAESQIWFSVDNEFADGLFTDTADAFVMLMMMVGMKTGQDIRVEAPVSAKLLFNIENTIQPIFVKALNGFKHIHIEAEPYTDKIEGNNGVGCCCSLGIDSFSSFLKHYGDNVSAGYHVTHLTLFNSGQLGDIDVEGAEKNLRETVESLKPFAEEVGLPIVAVNSNLNQLFRPAGITLLQSFIPRTLSCALALQKLFGKYLYSSSYSVEDFTMSDTDISHMEQAYVPLISTQNLETVLSNPAMTRVEKTKFIAQFPITEKYLDVCWAKQMAYGANQTTVYMDQSQSRNCGFCDKCLRTILTLDLMGKLDKYAGIFDLRYYHRKKEMYIAKVIANQHTNAFYHELAGLMDEVGYKPTAKVLFYKIVFRLNGVRNLYNNIKRLFK